MPETTNQFALYQDLDLTSLCLEGDRVRLRSVQLDYAESIFREFTEEITHYMFPKAASEITETQAFIDESIRGMKAKRDLCLVVLRKQEEGEEFLGCCGIHGREGGNTPELGIWIKQSAHGYGLGREAIRLASQWALEHLAFDYLVYPVDRANLPSRRIPESMGGVVIEEKRSPTQRGTELDLLVYKLTPEALRRL